MSLDPQTHRTFRLHVLQWARLDRRLRAAIQRFERVIRHREYECFGGPLDGKSVPPDPAGVTMYRGRGYYEKGADLRLHYHQLAPSWFQKQPFQSRRTGMTTTKINNGHMVGPFTEEEIVDVARSTVNELVGLNFDELEEEKQNAFIAQTIGAIAGIDPDPIQQEFGETPTVVATEFRRLAIERFKESPKWDSAQFIAGYAYSGPIGQK